MRPVRLFLPFLGLLLLSSPVLAQEAGYGTTKFPNSGDEAAQEPFLQGLLMLHSFEYVDARKAFQEAQRIDPDFAMAHWGEAMTHNHPVWMEQDREAGLQALQEFAPTPEERIEKAQTEREKDYLHTIHVLYGAGEDEPASKEERDDAYEQAMAELAETYPDDLDAQAFHALSILGTAHEGRDFATYMRAAAIAEEVFDANPEHPGAAHYLIHAYDDPVHAPLGLRPARVYADIAPGASHALHMPSHIFFALGMWDRAAASNVDSYEAAKSTTEERGEPLNGHGYHALQWLAYARAQQGQYEKTRQTIETGLHHTFAVDSIAAGYENYIRSSFQAMYVVETERWDAVDTLAMNPDAASPRQAASIHMVKGMAALKRDNRAVAEQALEAARAALPEDADEMDRIPVLQLEGLLAFEEMPGDAALERLKTAADREDDMPLDFGPPWPLKPSHELLGDVLLELNRPDEALSAFERTLERYPGRALALRGKAKAAAQAGKSDVAASARSTLAEQWEEAGPAARARLEALSEASSTASSNE